MAATIRFGRSLAYINEGRWYSADAPLATYLQAFTRPEDVPASAPDFDNCLAVRVADLGACHVVSLSPPEEDDQGADLEGQPVY